MKKVTALAASIAFALGMVGSAAAQTSTAPATAPPAAKDDMKKSDTRRRPIRSPTRWPSA